MRTTPALLAGALIIGTLTAAGSPAAADLPPEAGPPPSLGTIAVVPLDDRPFPTYTPVKVGEAGGHEVLTPPEEQLGEFFSYGDADAVGDWWQGAADAADGSIVAVPMLAYGGLVASRNCDSTLETALDRLEVLQQVKAANPDEPLYAFDVIQRLTIAPTSGYPGSYSGQVRRWAELIDLVENLGHEELRAEYEALITEIPEEIRSDYLCARARNHAVNEAMVHAAADGIIDYLILGQDDASEFGPHRAEKEQLLDLIDELDVADRVKVYPGADVLGALLVAKLVVNRLGVSPTVQVEWSRSDGADWIAPYQDIPYADVVGNYLDTLGAQRLDAEDADILLAANTAGAGSLEPFVETIQEGVATGRLVAVGDDARAGVVDPELRNLLDPVIDVGELASWSGWNVGVSLSQSVVRAALLEASRGDGFLAGSSHTRGEPVLQARRTLLAAAATAHEELLFSELVHTDLYRNHVRTSIKQYAVDHGDDPQLMTTALEGANELAVTSTRPLAEELFAEEFQGVPLRLGSDGRTELTAVIGNLTSLDLGLAWPRYQGLDVVPTVSVDVGATAAAPLAVTLLPSTIEVAPERTTEVELRGILRNTSALPVSAEIRVDAPTSWDVLEPQSVQLAAFEVHEVAVDVQVPALAAVESATVTLVADQVLADGQPAESSSAQTQITAIWRNVALASMGAVATASSYSGYYTPGRAIDGNTTSTGSRWLTPAGEAHWLEVTFADEELIDTVELFEYDGYLLYDYTLSALVDGAWQTVATVSDNTDANPLYQFDPVHATAVRLDIIATRDSRVRLYELEATCRTKVCTP